MVHGLEVLRLKVWVDGLCLGLAVVDGGRRRAWDVGGVGFLLLELLLTRV